MEESGPVTVKLREALVERQALGVERLTENQTKVISACGYESFFMGLVSSERKIGSKLFHRLAGMGRLDLTTEYLVFHYLREQLAPRRRVKLAALLRDATPRQ
jgi:hypothetical protein